MHFHEVNTPAGLEPARWAIRDMEELYYPYSITLLNPFHSGWSYHVWPGDWAVGRSDEELDALRIGWQAAEIILQDRTYRIYRELFKEQ